MITYILLRILSEFLAVLPRRALFALGNGGGLLLYFFHREFRKKTMTSLSVAFGKTKGEKELKKIARASFQNLCITCLEFISLKKTKVKKYIEAEGGEEIAELLKKKQGVVFVSAHQANWEIPFLMVTSLFPGIAIGRPIKNKRIYKWILSVRESYGGKIVMPKNALKSGLKALSEGNFIGIVGDQGFPSSSYNYPLFGTRAWTSTAPALLACRANAPLVAAMTRREGLKYVITCSPPIWPNPSEPLKEEVPRLMNEAMRYLEKSIEKRPSEWLWQHDRWKQQKIDHVKREYRYAFILVILPEDPSSLLPHLSLFDEIYPRGFITFLAPEKTSISKNVIHYKKREDLFLKDWRYQIVFDFYDDPKLRRHYKKLGAFQTLNLKKLEKISGEKEFPEILHKAICKDNAPRSLFY